MSIAVVKDRAEARESAEAEAERTRRCAPTFGCSGVCSATPCASRRRRVSPSSSGFARLDPLPPRQRDRRAARAGGDARQPRRRPDAEHRARLQLFLASFQHREDQHHIRRNRAHVQMKSEPRPGALDYAFKRAADAGVDARALRAFFDHALVSPVLTAHRPRSGARAR